VQPIDDAGRVEWDAYVASAPHQKLYHLYAWRDVIRTAFGGETHYLAAYRHGRIVGVLPLGRLNSKLFGNFLVSLPYFNYGGVLADDAAASQSLWSAAVELAGRLKCSHFELRHDDQLFPDIAVRTDKVTMLLPLPGSSEALNKQLSSKLRSQIKRPTREGAIGESGGIELLDDFYAVFAQNMRDLGTPVYAPGLFANILRQFPDKARLFVVRVAGKPVAAAFIIGHAELMEIPWASSLREANHLSVNMLLYWEVLKWSADNGYRWFDFGRSTVDAGTFKFKKQWGAEPKQLYWHYWMKDGGGPPKINPSNPKYALLIAAWQRLPLFVANWIGPKLIKHLP
jgi:FemAB-related protein (PEP-CTERM system-associated)